MSNEAGLGHDDLTPEQTEGFKVGEKKTIDEYQKLGELGQRHFVHMEVLGLAATHPSSRA